MRSVPRSVVASLFLIAVGACQPASDVSASAAAAVLAADSAWAEAFAQKDVEGYLSFVDSSASIQQPNGATVTGRAAIGEMIAAFYAMPNLTGTWRPAHAEAARSGDLAYTTGSFQFHFTDPAGNAAVEKGKYLEVWRKQADGSWKMIVESFNSDEPLPETGAPAPG